MNFTEKVKGELSEVEKSIYSIIPGEPKEVYGMLPPFIKRGGKRIRPVLTLLACKAVCGDAGKAVLPAALIEIFHNFTLIHDDIEDDSKFRRGEPTLNVSYGIPIALNSGDALYTLLWNAVASNTNFSPEKKIEMQGMLSAAFLKVVEGQGIELNWYKESKVDVSEDDYYRMVGGKTGALVALSCEIGAYVGGADKKTCAKFREFGHKIGVAFQIQDDVLNVTGDFDKYKKEIGGDITEGKRTLMLVKAFERAGKSEREELERILLSHTSSKEEISKFISILQKHGAVEYARSKALGLVNEAKSLLSGIPDSPAKQALAEAADFSISREV